MSADADRYKHILDRAPLGFYIVKTITKDDEDVDVIEECNEEFARMFGYDGPEDVIGIDVRDFYESVEEWPHYREELAKRDKAGGPPVGIPLHFKSKDGRPFTVEIFGRVLHDDPQNLERITGRVGFMRETTRESGMRELIQDLGRLIHPYTGLLQMMEHSLDAIEKSIGYEPFKPDKRHSVSSFLERPATTLKAILKNLLEEKEIAPGPKKQRLDELHEFLEKYTSIIDFSSMYPPALREAACEITEITGSIKPEPHFKEKLNDVKYAALRLQRIASLADIYLRRLTIEEMEYQTHFLREYMIGKSRPVLKKSICLIADLIDSAAANNNEYARARNVSVKREGRFPDTKVEVVELDIIRALGSLLHNAIKYSLEHKEEGELWVSISCNERDEFANIGFENYGVYITPEEIESGVIFEIGYRGQHSGDRGRLGTGIGLADVRMVARQHGGDVLIKSLIMYETRLGVPVAKTTVTMRLPVYKKEA